MTDKRHNVPNVRPIVRSANENNLQHNLHTNKQRGRQMKNYVKLKKIVITFDMINDRVINEVNDA